VPLTDTYRSFLFDLDGTLTDPKEGITKSVHFALEKLGVVNIDTNSLVKFIGPPLKESFIKYFSFSEENAERAIDIYREYFSVKGLFENEIYPGVDSILKKLNERGLTIVIATSKPTIYAKKICDHFGILQYFTAIEGSEMDGRRSGKRELIEYIMMKYTINRDETLMIGDREHDIVGAKGNSIKSIGVGYGYGSEEELTDAGADYFVPSIRDLSRLLMGEDT
jgi:phosphoglycolate phosphatase